MNISSVEADAAYLDRKPAETSDVALPTAPSGTGGNVTAVFSEHLETIIDAMAFALMENDTKDANQFNEETTISMFRRTLLTPQGGTISCQTKRMRHRTLLRLSSSIPLT